VRYKHLLRNYGLPQEIRPKLWLIISGAWDKREKNPELYKQPL
jgi:hypothetical protein